MGNTMIYRKRGEGFGCLSRGANQTPEGNVHNRRIHNTSEYTTSAVITDMRSHEKSVGTEKVSDVDWKSRVRQVARA